MTDHYEISFPICVTQTTNPSSPHSKLYCSHRQGPYVGDFLAPDWKSVIPVLMLYVRLKTLMKKNLICSFFRGKGVLLVPWGRDGGGQIASARCEWVGGSLWPPVAQRRRGSSYCFRVDDLIGFAFRARDVVSVVILFRDWYDVFFAWPLGLSSAEENNTSQKDQTKS